MDASGWNERYGQQELVWTAQPNRFLVEELTGATPGRTLDVACGEGRNAVWLAEQGWRVTAVDFSTVGLDKARRLADARGVQVDWVLADVVDYDPPAAAFDLVVILYLHLAPDERQRVLERAAAAVAAAGTVLIVGHDRDNLERGYGGPPDPAILLTPAMAGELTGLRTVRAEQVTRAVTTSDGGRTAIDTLIRAEAPAA